MRSIYVGSGETAALISQLETVRRDTAETECAARRREVARYEQQDATIEAACKLIDTVMEAALLAAGFHTHKRQWRMRRYVNYGGEGSDEAKG